MDEVERYIKDAADDFNKANECLKFLDWMSENELGDVISDRSAAFIEVLTEVMWKLNMSLRADDSRFIGLLDD